MPGVPLAGVVKNRALCRLVNDSIQLEMKNSQDEQKHLKDCQIKYLFSSLAFTGIILGVDGIFGSNTAAKTETSSFYQSTVFLIPLLVVLPCSWIFFDKAKTIARHIGYYLALEEMREYVALELSGKHNSSGTDWKFLGWETTLIKFRALYASGNLHRNDDIYRDAHKYRGTLVSDLRDDKAMLKDWGTVYNITKRRKQCHYWEILTFSQNPHKYWISHFFIFTSMTCLSLLLFAFSSGLSLQNNGPYAWALLLIACLISLRIVAINLENVRRLVFGQNSYHAHYQSFKELLTK